MEFIIGILWAILCGYVCVKIAENCNSNTLIAALLGAIFNGIAVIGYGIYYLVKKN